MVDSMNSTSNNQNADNDDWEVAVDTGEFDKRLEQQEKARAAVQESLPSPALLSTNDDDNRTMSSVNMMKSNKPIRILKRPTSQSQLLNNNTNESNTSNQTNTSSTTVTTTTSMTIASCNNNNNNSSSPFSNNISSSITVPAVSIIPRNQTKDSITTTILSQNTISSTGSTKPPIKTYEQREIEYKLARLRIMGEEESSAKDDDEIPVVDSAPVINTDDTSSKTSSTITRASLSTSNKMVNLSQQQPPPLQSHSTPGSYASNLYALNNAPSAPATINFTPNNNSTVPFSSPNFSQPHYRGAYSAPYSQMPPPPSQRYPLPVTTTTTLYMTSTAPFVTAASSSSSSSTLSSSYHYPPPQQHPHMTTNNWYPPYQQHHQQQQQQTPYGTQQYGHPQ